MPLTEIAVEDAYGMVEAELEVEVMVPPTKRLFETYPPPCTESMVLGVDVPTPTFPLSSAVKIGLDVVPLDEVEEAMLKSVLAPSPQRPRTESLD